MIFHRKSWDILDTAGGGSNQENVNARQYAIRGRDHKSVSREYFDKYSEITLLSQTQVCSDDNRDGPTGASFNQGALGFTSGAEVNGYEV